MPSRLNGAPAGFERPPRLRNRELTPIVIARLNGGMFTSIDAADIPNEALQRAKNATIRFDVTSRRAGTTYLAPDGPDAQAVMGLAYAKLNNGDEYVVRFINDTPIHVLDSGVWVPVTIEGFDTDGTLFERPSFTTYKDTFIYTSNGLSAVRSIDLITKVAGDLPDSGNYRYVTTFFNRVVGAANRGIDETEIGWSADGLPNVWDPIINPSAGKSALSESPAADHSDFITGIHGFTSSIVVLRERSVWEGTKQPIPTNPFYFRATVPGIGCDCPYSLCVIEGGLIWLDLRTRGVYVYRPGGGLEKVNTAVENSMMNAIIDKRLVYAAYDSKNHEYHIAISRIQEPADFISASLDIWTYNFGTKAWSYSTRFNITALAFLRVPPIGSTIDELGDTPIDELPGTVDTLGVSNISIEALIYGRVDGEWAYSDASRDYDEDSRFSGDANNFSLDLVSKAIVLPKTDTTVSHIKIEYVCKKTGTLKLYYSKNGGATEDSWRLVKTLTDVEVTDESRLISINKALTCRKIAWRLVADSGFFDILGYELDVYKAGDSKK